MAAPCTEHVECFQTAIDRYIRDDQFLLLNELFHASGRGRRPNLSKDTIDNRLLIQFDLLKTETGDTWKQILNFMKKFIPSFYSKIKFRGLVNKSVSLFQKKLNYETEESMLIFLETRIDLTTIGPYLQEVSIGRPELVDNTMQMFKDRATQLKEAGKDISNGLVIELELFRRNEDVQYHQFLKWMEILLDVTFSTEKLNKIVKKTFEEMRKKQKRKHEADGKVVWETFLSASFVLHVDSISNTCVPDVDGNTCVLDVDNDSNTCVPDVDSNTCESCRDTVDVATCTTDTYLELAHKEIKIKCLTRKLEDRDTEMGELKTEVLILNDVIQDHLSTTKSLHLQLSEKNEDIKGMKTIIDRDNKEIDQLKESVTACNSIKQSAYYQRLKRQEEKLTEMQDIVTQHSDNGCEKKMLQLKSQIKSLQTELSNCKKSILKTKINVSNLKRQFGPDTHSMSNLQTRTDSSNKFTADIVRCVMELIGEAEVPSNRCGRVMQIVVRQLFKQDMPLTEFPSERTAIRMSDTAHALAKSHVGEVLVNSKGYDLHSDGTDKDKNKIMGHQVTTKETGTLSLGFVGVQTENTDTLLDVAINLLRELAYVYDENELEKTYLTMLSNLTGLMSDRASVMKSFNRQFNETRKKVLDKSDNLEFIHCNAHFLLGLSTAAEKTLTTVEKSLGEVLGRDNVSHIANRFRSSSENSTSRYIRTGCDSLGPRGDQKNGCRDAWDAYCHMTDKKSYISSYRSNRFNNFFHAGAVLHHHRQDIQNFFKNYHPDGNMKLQSVQADCRSDRIDQFLVAVGILYFRVTGPYWNLLNSKTKYLDFYQFVEKMLDSFKAWAEDATPLLSRNMTPMFTKFTLPETEEFTSLFDLPIDHAMTVKSTLEQICCAFVSVTERQLSDFLEGGRYYNIKDEDLRNKMSHCQLTNLFGEACFGDLDFSIFKRRNASLHYHSTVNMLKRNKTMSVWFQNKSEEQQLQLLHNSAKKAPVLRANHQQMQRDVVQKRKLVLEENHKKNQKKEQDIIIKRQDIARTVKQHGGPCLSSLDVDKLLNSFPDKGSKTLKLAAIKSEIRYQQMVMGVRNRKLKLSGKLEELVTSLKIFLDDTRCSDLSNECETTNNQYQISNCENEPPVVSQDDQSSDQDDEPLAMLVKSHEAQEFGNFQFANQGTRVGIYYDDDFYIGEVVNIISTSSAVVSFMQKCGVQKCSYRWPTVDDEDTVSSQYIIHYDFDMHTTNGRVWSVEDGLLERMYAQYKDIFC